VFEIKIMRTTIITILILIVYVQSICAQTEIPSSLIDTAKQIKTENFLQKNSIDNLLHNPYPSKLPIDINLHDEYNPKPTTARKDTTSSNLLYVRSVFATNESPLFGNLPIKKDNNKIIITVKIKQQLTLVSAIKKAIKWLINLIQND
jgi:hypothetical protein